MSGDVHVRIRERLGVRFPRATRHVAAFQYESDAQRFYQVLGKRLAQYGLTLAADKTRLLLFSIHHVQGAHTAVRIEEIKVLQVSRL